MAITGRTIDATMPTRHSVLAVLVAVTWGVNFVVIHVGLDSFPPLFFAGLRFTLVALPAVLFIKRPDVPLRWILAVGAFLSAGQFGLLFVAMEQGMPAGLASLVLQTQALFTIGLGVVLLKERPSRRIVTGALVASAGIGVIAVGRAEAVPFVAILLCIGAGLSWGIGNISTRKAQSPNALGLLVWSSLVPPLPLFALSALTEHELPTVDVSGVLAITYVVVLSTFFGFGVWTWLIKQHAVAQVAPYTLLVPPVGIAAAWVALGEQPTATEVAGALVVLCGLAIVQRQPRQGVTAGTPHGRPARASARPSPVVVSGGRREVAHPGDLSVDAGPSLAPAARSRPV